ncbi:MAG: hypothetical protein AAFR54_19200 [Planctomycetota bacterium]
MRLQHLPALALGAALLACGCQSYNDRVAGAMGSFARGDFTGAEAGFASVGSGFLRGVESGTAAFTDGRFGDARRHFESAQRASEGLRDRALIDPEELVEDVLSLAINESQSSYEGEGYERVMLHVMLALTYLAEGAAEDVVVEARRVDEILTGEQELYGTDYGAGGIGHLLSAVAYELIGKPDAAYIDYRRMADKDLAPDLVGAALLRLSQTLGRRDELSLWEQRYGAAPPVSAEPLGSIVLIGGLGLGPAKREQRIDVPVNGGVFAWAVPSFGPGSGRTRALFLEFPDAGLRVESDVVEDVAAVAKENLDDRIALIAARSAARGLLKRQLADQMRDNKRGELLGVLADVFTVASERADLRAWRTLPRQWVAARAFVPAGEPTAVALSEGGGATVPLGTFRLEPGETMFVLARALDSGVVAHVVGGEVVAPEPNTPSPISAGTPGSNTP